MNRILCVCAFILCTMLIASPAVFAQNKVGNRTPVPVQQVAKQPATKAGPPPVEICNKQMIRGVWKLIRVFETPAGAASDDLKQRPFQYMWFRPDSVYYEIRGTLQLNDRAQAKEEFKRAAGNTLTQYVFGKKGALYLYRDRVSTGGQYCGIVMKNQPPYRKGDMVFTPFEAQNGVSVFYQYRKPFAGRQNPGAGQ